jgi:hypothetical protein
MFHTIVVEKIKTHIVCSVTFFLKSCRFLHNVEKSSRAGQPTDDKMAHARYLRLQTRILGTCNTNCFPTATMVASTRLSVTLQWRTQEFFSGGGGVKQIQLRTDDIENGDLIAVASELGVLEAAVIWYKKFHFI